ncbi:hypothetical protein [Deinococcus sp.]|uniref:hypothetical protein n=1 Tax=Deinococcus sp. TaxID=47478 RepID=UPI003C7BE411
MPESLPNPPAIPSALTVPAALRPLRLNLAALTAEELQHLLGEAAAQRLMPEISQARLEGRAVAGDVIPREQEYQPQAERNWGATPELARQLSALRQELVALGGSDLGVLYQPLLSEVRHLRAYLFTPDTAVALRWSETPESVRAPTPFLLAATLMRDRASGTAAVLSSTSALPFVPTQSEETDARLYQGASAQTLLETHRVQVSRHGRGVRLGQVEGHGLADWLKVYTAVRQLNLTAWTRRGLLVQDG